MSINRIRRSQNNSTRQSVAVAKPTPQLDYDKMTPAQQEQFRKALAQSPEFKKALAEKAKSDPKLKAAIVAGMRKQAAEAKAALTAAEPAPGAAPKPASAPPTFSSRSLTSRGWNVTGQPAVVSPREALTAKARANAVARSRAEEVAKQKAAQEAAAAQAAQVRPRARPHPTAPLTWNPIDVTFGPLKQSDGGEFAGTNTPVRAVGGNVPTNTPKVHADVAGSAEAYQREWRKLVGRNQGIIDAESKTLTDEERQVIMTKLSHREKAGALTTPEQVKQLVTYLEDTKSWEAEIKVEFPQLSKAILHRSSRFPEAAINAIRSVKGVPGTHNIPLQRGRRVFTIVNDDRGKLVSANTDTKGPGKLKKFGQVVGTFLSVAPTPVQPFAAAVMAVDGADQAIKDGDTLGAVVNVAAAVTIGTGYASGAAAAAGNTSQAATLATVADTAKKVGTVAQVGKAVKDKDGLALLNAVGNAAVDFEIGDPTKAITAVNLIHGAKQGDLAGVLSTAANYARANGNHESANVLRGAATALGTAEGLEDGDWNKVAMHLGLGLNDIQQEKIRTQIEPNRPDTNQGEIEPGNQNTRPRINLNLPSLGPATDDELDAVRKEVDKLEAKRNDAQTKLEEMRKNDPSNPGIAGFEESIATLEYSIQLKEEEFESMAMDGIAIEPAPQDQLGFRTETPVLTAPLIDSEKLLKGQLELMKNLEAQRDGAVDFRKTLIETNAPKRQIEDIDATIKIYEERLQSEQRVLERIRRLDRNNRPTYMAGNDLPVDEIVVRGTRVRTPNVSNFRISQRNDNA